jgi:hypothetical protein
MSRVSIVGAYNTKFGSLIDVKDMISFKKKIDRASFNDLVVEAGRGASPTRAWPQGHRRGLDRQLLAGPLRQPGARGAAGHRHRPRAALQADDPHRVRLRVVLGRRLRRALRRRAGRFKNVLVIGVEK